MLSPVDGLIHEDETEWARPRAVNLGSPVHIYHPVSIKKCEWCGIYYEAEGKLQHPQICPERPKTEKAKDKKKGKVIDHESQPQSNFCPWDEEPKPKIRIRRAKQAKSSWWEKLVTEEMLTMDLTKAMQELWRIFYTNGYRGSYPSAVAELKRRRHLYANGWL
jgi:hypothetical protein